MEQKHLEAAIERLQRQYNELDWRYHDFPVGSQNEKMYRWPGPPEEKVLVLVHQSSGEQELFHRHDFFYFNYTYQGEYDSISYKYDHKITIREGELYAGQPFAGHALCVHDNRNTVIIGVLIQRDTFFRAFLPMLSSKFRLFRFFTTPSTNQFSEEFLHFRPGESESIRELLEMMVVEYAFKQEDTQDVLKALALAFLLQIARQYTALQEGPPSGRVSDQIVQYMSAHLDTVTLTEIASRFSYHPNYVSSLLRREQGKTFSKLLLEQRMERASCLLEGTGLSVEEISWMLGYSNSSNFYKAFREYFGHSPRNGSSAKP